MKKIRLLLADDNHPMRLLLGFVLQQSEDLEIVGEAQNGREAVEFSRSLFPDVIIMDINMPHMTVIEATHAIRTELPNIRFIGFSMFDNPQVAQSMIDAGAAICLSKSLDWDSIVSGIRQVISESPVTA